MKLEEILQTLPNLKQSELQVLRARVDFLLSLKSDDSADWLIIGILEELKRRGLSAGPDWRQHAPAGWTKNVEEVRNSLLSKLKKPLSTAEQYVLGRLAAKALADYLNPVVALSLKIMLQNIRNIPTALDASYPGYLEAGTLEFMLRGK